jgi:hypothetical protein
VVSLHNSKELKLHNKTTGLIRKELNEYDKYGKSTAETNDRVVGRAHNYVSRHFVLTRDVAMYVEKCLTTEKAGKI